MSSQRQQRVVLFGVKGMGGRRKGYGWEGGRMNMLVGLTCEMERGEERSLKSTKERRWSWEFQAGIQARVLPDGQNIKLAEGDCWSGATRQRKEGKE